MTSLQDLLPHPGSTNWRKTRSLTTDSDEDQCIVRHVVIREVWLERRPWPHAVYKIDVMSQTSHWFVFKRYKEFYQLHQKLVKLYSVPRDLLPPRKIAKNLAKENLESRRESLEHYLQKMLNSCNGAVRRSEELSEFLDVKSHDVPHVTHDLARYVQKNGQSILMSKEMFHLSPSQLYCLSKQLQLPHPSARNSIDLGNLYEFIAELKKLTITDFVSQQTHGEQHEISFTFDLSMFSSLRVLQIDAVDIESLRGVESLCSKLNKLTARYCLSSMKSLLIDAAIEKKKAPQINLSAESWRVQAAYRLTENRFKLCSWNVLTFINFSHNNITTFDSSMHLLPALKQLDLSHNKINHLDLEQLPSSCLHTLSLASNSIYMISGATKPIDNLKKLNLSHNKIQNMEGLLCCQGLEELNINFNNIAALSEVKKLSSLLNLYQLSVEGNHFAKKKRHRIIIFAYFRQRELILDKKPINSKEQAKLDAKFDALENFEDIDDSLSSISTVSDESDLDSGIDSTNWVLKLTSLSEVEEEDGYEVLPRISWQEVHQGGSEDDDDSSSINSPGNLCEASVSRKEMTRNDWDRVLNTDTSNLLKAKSNSLRSVNTLQNDSENSRHSTICNDATDDSSTRVCTRTVSEDMKKIEINYGGDPIRRQDFANAQHRQEPRERTSRWVSSIFRGKSYPLSGSKHENASSEFPVNDDVCDNSGLVIIPEIEEVRVEETDVSRSFDDNCEFEKAEECDEETDENEN